MAAGRLRRFQQYKFNQDFYKKGDFLNKNNVKLVLIIKMLNGQLLILDFGVFSVLDPRCSVPILKSLGGAGAEWVCNGN